MRHLKRGRRLNRNAAHRRALWRNMTISLFMSEQGRIVTTQPKAKELRRHAEKLITLAKKGGEANRRRAFAALRNQECVDRLFSDIAPQFEERPGGYTRIIKWNKRLGDKAQRVIFELCTEENAFPSDDDQGTSQPKAVAPTVSEASDDEPADDQAGDDEQAEVESPEDASAEDPEATEDDSSEEDNSDESKSKE